MRWPRTASVAQWLLQVAFHLLEASYLIFALHLIPRGCRALPFTFCFSGFVAGYA